MPSKIEDELLQATGCKPQKKDEDRQKFLDRLCSKVQDMKDDDFDKLSTPAQDWSNAVVEPWSHDEEIDDFPDLQGTANGEDPEMEVEEDEVEEEEEVEAEADEEAEEEAEEADEDEEQEEEVAEEEGEEVVAAKPARVKAAKPDKSKRRAQPVKHSKAKAPKAEAKKAAPAKKIKSKSATPRMVAKADKKKRVVSATKRGTGGYVRHTRRLIWQNPQITVDDLITKVTKAGFTPSRFSVQSVRADTRDSIRAGIEAGKVPKTFNIV